jgi:hypothetical protein
VQLLHNAGKNRCPTSAQSLIISAWLFDNLNKIGGATRSHQPHPAPKFTLAARLVSNKVWISGALGQRSQKIKTHVDVKLSTNFNKALAHTKTQSRQE